MASISCSCGQVEILFPITTAPKTFTECCCDQCFLRVHYLEKKGGAKVPSHPLRVKTLDNHLVFVQGKDKLQLYKTTKDTLLINMASTCCNTYLIGRHSGYHYSGSLATMADFCKYQNLDDSSQPTSRWFTNKWTPERLSQYEKLPALWVNEEDGSLEADFEGWQEVFQAQVAALQVPVPEDAHAPGETFEDVVEHVVGKGGGITILNEQ